MYIAGAIIAVLAGVIVWQRIQIAGYRLTVANLETDHATCLTEVERRGAEIAGFKVTVQAQSKAIGQYKADMDAAQAASRSLLAEVELSNKARQGRIRKVWGWVGDTCQSVMPKVREALGLK